MTDDPPAARPRRREARDERLLEDARLGDHAAFAELIRGDDDQMRALAWTVLRDRSAMDDALQDAYLQAYRNLDRFRGESRFSTWLHQIVYRACLDQVRRRRPVDPLPEIDPAATGRAQGEVDDRLTIERALAALDPETAAALVLVDRDGHSYEEAGAVLDIPAGTVASRLHRGRRALRAALEPTRTTDPGTDPTRGETR